MNDIGLNRFCTFIVALSYYIKQTLKRAFLDLFKPQCSSTVQLQLCKCLCFLDPALLQRAHKVESLLALLLLFITQLKFVSQLKICHTIKCRHHQILDKMLAIPNRPKDWRKISLLLKSRCFF